MPALPQPLRRPHPWLAMVAVLIGLFAFDICRSPERQVAVRGYAGLVEFYRWGKRLFEVPGVCRFSPSCSHYSVEAVKKHGLIEGLKLTVDRLDRCRTNIPSGTPDPVR